MPVMSPIRAHSRRYELATSRSIVVMVACGCSHTRARAPASERGCAARRRRRRMVRRDGTLARRAGTQGRAGAKVPRRVGGDPSARPPARRRSVDACQHRPWQRRALLLWVGGRAPGGPPPFRNHCALRPAVVRVGAPTTTDAALPYSVPPVLAVPTTPPYTTTPPAAPYAAAVRRMPPPRPRRRIGHVGCPRSRASRARSSAFGCVATRCVHTPTTSSTFSCVRSRPCTSSSFSVLLLQRPPSASSSSSSFSVLLLPMPHPTHLPSPHTPHTHATSIDAPQHARAIAPLKPPRFLGKRATCPRRDARCSGGRRRLKKSHTKQRLMTR